MGFVEDELKQLKDVISNLDSRIKSLEQRATGSAPTTQEIRMILIGPPGAGAHSPLRRPFRAPIPRATHRLVLTT